MPKGGNRNRRRWRYEDSDRDQEEEDRTHGKRGGRFWRDIAPMTIPALILGGFVVVYAWPWISHDLLRS